MPPQTARRTTTQRGLGWRHQQAVDALKRRHVDGAPCWWCGEGMYRTQELDGDHSQPRSRGGVVTDRLLHRSCNRQRGDGSRDHQRPALTGRAVAEGQAADDRSAWCLLTGW
ncbi:hypothetical protein [Nocardia sp. NPDC046763]|uniref:hypothetical protein n=1 Tax=Nocardia sp. NPDC046763 TaxID=3155256 RepID=UPI0033D397EE